MNAECFADLVHARRTSASKWQARCPSHEDSSPSLSIAEGTDGRVLVRCWAGCSLASILAALHLTKRDLFAGRPVTPQQSAMLAAQREAKAARERQQRMDSRAERERLWKLECIRDTLGGKLARSPDDSEIGRLFHLACDRLHQAENALYPIAPELGGKRMEPPGEGPHWVGAALTDIGRDFQPKKQATRCERAA